MTRSISQAAAIYLSVPLTGRRQIRLHRPDSHRVRGQKLSRMVADIDSSCDREVWPSTQALSKVDDTASNAFGNHLRMSHWLETSFEQAKNKMAECVPLNGFRDLTPWVAAN